MIPILSKVEAIESISVPPKVHDVRRCIGLVNCYRDMWCKHVHTISPLTKIFLTNIKFKWTDVENGAFIAIKTILVHDVLLSYPNLNERFIIHTDVRKAQLGGVIIQNVNPVASYSRQLTPAQINYTTI